MAKKYYWLFAVFVVVYIVTILVTPPDPAALAHYHITALQLQLIDLTIIVPGVLIWFAAFYSIVNVGKYAATIKNSIDGRGFKYLLWGLMALGLTMPIGAIVSAVLNFGVRQGMVTQAVATITTTHLSAVFYLVGFYLLYRGALILLRSVEGVRLSQRQLSAVLLAICVIGVPYMVATLLNPSRGVVVAPALTATYYLPDWLIATTIILPYVLAWTFGFYATLFLHMYNQQVGGKIYRTSLAKLNRGFFVVIVLSIVLQFLTAAVTSLSGWGLGAVLVLLYVLLACIGVGYVLIALGAKGLAKLEEVT